MPDGDFHAIPAEKLPFADASFDLVSCLGSLEHFVEPVVSLREMARVARGDAQFLILVPNADFLTRKLKLFGGTNQKDAKEALTGMEGLRYREKREILPGIHIRYQDAGHILGSASVEVWLNENGVERKVVFSGEVGTVHGPVQTQFGYHLLEITSRED